MPGVYRILGSTIDGPRMDCSEADDSYHPGETIFLEFTAKDPLFGLMDELERALVVVVAQRLHEVCEHLRDSSGQRVFDPHPWNGDRHWVPLLRMSRRVAREMAQQLPLGMSSVSPNEERTPETSSAG